MKKSVLLSLLFVISLNTISALDFSLTGTLDSFDPETIFLLLSFLIILTLLNFSLMKFFKDSPKVGSILSILLALMFTYGLYLWDVDFGNFLYDYSDIIPWVVIVLLIFSFWKFKWKTLLGAGALFILLEFLEVGENEGALMSLGIMLIGAYLISKFLWWLVVGRKKKRETDSFTGGVTVNITQPNQQMQVIEREKIIYKERERSVRDLQQKYEAYKFTVFRTNLQPHQRRQMLKAMYIIQDYLKKLGTSVKGQSPRDIENTLKKRGLI